MLNTAGKKIRVLICDDSSFMRMAIRSVLGRDQGIEVVATAADGVEATEKAALYKPDVITMDMEMPRMDGISALKKIMATSPTRVIMVSTLTSAGATATFDALEAGAVDYVPKNMTDTPDTQEQFRSELLRKVKEAGSAPFNRKQLAPAPAAAAAPAAPAAAPTASSTAAMSTASAPAAPQVLERLPAAATSRRVNYVGIGASTGGPTAVLDVLSRLPAKFPQAVLVAIHMPKTFTKPYAERLNSKCALPVREAVDGDLLKPGVVLVAPGGSHTTLVRRAEGLVIRLSAPSAYPQHFYVPSVDLMMSSMADATNGSMLGVVLTGMGNDGLKGMQHLKRKGGVTLVQDEATSTIYGMPRACIEAGIADAVLPLGQIGAAIVQVSGG